MQALPIAITREVVAVVSLPVADSQVGVVSLVEAVSLAEVEVDAQAFQQVRADKLINIEEACCTWQQAFLFVYDKKCR